MGLDLLFERSALRAQRLVIMVALLACTSCSRIRRKAKAAHMPAVTALAQKYPAIEEARLSDISLPLGVTAFNISSPEPDHGLAILYISRSSAEELVDFYAHDMERQGWRLEGKLIALDRVVLLFDKPTCRLVITIRTLESGTEITLYRAMKPGLGYSFESESRDAEISMRSESYQYF